MINNKKVAVIVLLVCCCVACAFAHGASESAISIDNKVVYTANGVKIEFPKPIQMSATYDVACYRYQFELDGNQLVFKYIDAVGDSEIPVIAQALMSVLPGAVSYSNPAAGNITIVSKYYLGADEFDGFVKAAEALIYDTIY